MPDYRRDINDSDYDEPYEERKRKFTNRPVPNYLRECVNRTKSGGENEINTFKKRKKVLS